MSDSTCQPSRRTVRNPYSQAASNDALASFLASRNLPVPEALKRPVRGKDRPSRSKKRQKHGEHEDIPEVRPCLLLS